MMKYIDNFRTLWYYCFNTLKERRNSMNFMTLAINIINLIILVSIIIILAMFIRSMKDSVICACQKVQLIS